MNQETKTDKPLSPIEQTLNKFDSDISSMEHIHERLDKLCSDLESKLAPVLCEPMPTPENTIPPDKEAERGPSCSLEAKVIRLREHYEDNLNLAYRKVSLIEDLLERIQL